MQTGAAIGTGQATESTDDIQLHTDGAVICPDGIDVTAGLSRSTPAAAAVSRVEVASADRVIALVDAAILGVSAFVRFAAIDEIDLLAVSGAPTVAALQPFLDRGVAVSVAGSQ